MLLRGLRAVQRNLLRCRTGLLCIARGEGRGGIRLLRGARACGWRGGKRLPFVRNIAGRCGSGRNIAGSPIGSGGGTPECVGGRLGLGLAVIHGGRRFVRNRPGRKWFGRQLLGRRGVNRQRLGLGLRHRDLFYRHRLCLGNRQRLCRLDRQRLRRLDRQRLRDGRSLFGHAADQCRQSLGLLEIRRHRLGIRKMPCHIVIVIHDVLLVSFVRSAHRASSDEHPPLSST